MMSEDWLAALLIGLLGAGHCLGMCGGIGAAVAMATPTTTHRWPFLLGYNFGRLASYVLAGFILGGALSTVIEVSGFKHGLAILRLLAALMLILLALYLAQIWNGLSYIENVGKYLWKFLSPLTSKFLPLSTPFAAIPFGMIWGWLPCGLVYSALSWSAVSGSAMQGAVLMLFFGLGTLPAMLLVGSTAESMKRFMNNLLFRRFTAAILLVYGIITAIDALKLF
ncbi:cytochrome biogenesis protein [Veronia nyctiphanis]|uniref:Cytochrome biogenesis protein n=1 Tax=Veronia nyctiphanis TaxID=1278244 RepID=A0A4Q0YSW2_9GAMM|nr:sulfite exporter TauE/SafE family protein [Veronia nyctiphanis]RXJ74347.1 cytochrome biogenesis protein [Veronia nyctiphanis]